MNKFIEVDLEIMKRNKKSPLRYLDEYLEVKNYVLTEGEYVEILTYIVENMAEEMAEKGETFSSQIADNTEKIEELIQSTPNSPERAAKVGKLRELINAIKFRKVKAMNAIKNKYKTMVSAVKGTKIAQAAGRGATKIQASKAGQVVGKGATRLKASKLGKQVIAHPRIAKAAVAGAGVAGALALYSRRKRKKEAAEKLGIK